MSEDAAATILDLAATLGVDYLIIGASQRTAMAKLLRGSVVTNVAQQLPESIHLIIYGCSHRHVVGRVWVKKNGP